MVPFIILTGVAVLVAMLALFVNVYLTFLIIAIWLPAYVWMRMITRQDDQRLNQLILRLRLRMAMYGPRRHWGAVTYTPLKYRKR